MKYIALRMVLLCDWMVIKMKLRILLFGTFLIISLFTGLGVFTRQSYTDIRDTEDYLEHLYVAEIPDNILMEDNLFSSKLSSAPLILRVEILKDVEHLYGTSQQLVCVKEVYCGDKIATGDEIYITSTGWRLILDYEIDIIERKFVNIPQVGHDYLVFLSDEIASFNTVSVYKLYEDIPIAPVFSYSDHPHTIAPTNGESTYVPYTAVRDNEFFTETEIGYQMLIKLKNNLIQTYPKTVNNN